MDAMTISYRIISIKYLFKRNFEIYFFCSFMNIINVATRDYQTEQMILSINESMNFVTDDDFPLEKNKS